MKRNSHRKDLVLTLRNEQGIALVIGLVIMILLVVLGGIMLYVTRTEIKVTSNYEQSVQALHAAEAGAEKVYDAFKQGDTDGDGDVDGSDVANANNDLDGNGTIDFTQVFVNGTPLPATDVNSGDTFATVSVDANDAPGKVIISSTGKPVGTNAERTIYLTLTSSAQIGGALNNSVPDGSP
jgi:type II secretory pathway pseudopilin PulG